MIERRSRKSSTADANQALRLAPLVAACLLAACAVPAERGLLPPPLITKQPANSPARSGSAVAASAAGMVVSDTPSIPAQTRESSVKPAGTAAAGETADTSLRFDSLPLPSFVQVVFGSVLKKNFSMDPAVLARTDLVTVSTGAQTPSQTLDTTRMLLKTYGLAVTELGGFYRIAPDNNLSAYSPEIRRGRAQPEVPLPLRPVYNLIEMTAVKAADVSGWLKAMFGAKINIQDDVNRNALLISGQPSDMVAALEAIQVLDQPLMRGRSSRLITPASLPADDLARKLAEILGAEGYAVSVGVGQTTPISLVTIPASNSMLVFTLDEAVLKHVLSWAAKIDALDNDSRRVGNYFSYTVKYADAQSLAKTMQELMSAPTQVAAPGAIGAPPPKAPGRIVVNTATNTLIFTSTQSEYQQLLSILRELDQPSKSALIEVTVAEVRVTDKAQLGIEWALPQSGYVQGGTQGGLGIGKDGLSLNFLSSARVVKANLNALASQNRANILSTPRIMARNGETATIQVGQEVPIVTSQQSNSSGAVVGGTSTTSPTGILQTIQYRSTGVILRVKPVIFSGDRIELDVSQEVSSAAETKTGVTTSPTITSRKVETKLSIKDGATWLLGGLMSSTDSKADTGIPLLKDLPLAGQLFRTNSDTTDKTELIVLITPYVINDDTVAEQVTQAFRNQLGNWAQLSDGLAKRPLTPASAASERAGTAPSSTPVVVEQGQAPVASSAPGGRPVLGLPHETPAKTEPAPTLLTAPARPAITAEASPSPASVANAPAAAAAADAALPVAEISGRPVTDSKLLDELKNAGKGSVPLAAPAASAPVTPKPEKPGKPANAKPNKKKG
ncbi:secretin N-terminal domain-containing protein [Paucibacter sp. APW11]|uniref:Secretin N-terminal domain-containing protein n=2 Tax=Roseateles aquae TaxID=3077235 RepID=A0ABU3PFB3_9BURK|nr:secretin N-terminal domain-containing protein [Paucibacter sp. APW11]